MNSPRWNRGKRTMMSNDNPERVELVLEEAYKAKKYNAVVATHLEGEDGKVLAIYGLEYLAATQRRNVLCLYSPWILIGDTYSYTSYEMRGTLHKDLFKKNQ